MPIKHAFTSAKSDGGDATIVRPSDWNAEHTFWEQVIDESGSSLSNWTSISGTWSTTGSIIQQTNTAAAHSKLRYNDTIIPGFGYLFEFETRIVAEHGSGDHNAGMGVAVTNSTTGGGLAVFVNRNDQTIQIERLASAVIHGPAFTNAANTWYKVRCLLIGHILTIWIDDVLFGQFVAETLLVTNSRADWVAIDTFACSADFRNIKCWIASIDLPA